MACILRIRPARSSSTRAITSSDVSLPNRVCATPPCRAPFWRATPATSAPCGAEAFHAAHPVLGPFAPQTRLRNGLLSGSFLERQPRDLGLLHERFSPLVHERHSRHWRRLLRLPLYEHAWNGHVA